MRYCRVGWRKVSGIINWRKLSMLKWVMAAALVAVVPAAASAQDAAAGKAVFNKCRACHSFEKNMVGPSLAGIVGRKAGTAEGFNYSDAMKNSGKTWDEASLDAYITDPKAAVPGNKMVFPGVKDEADRKNLIAFLKTDGK
jgi:cytochrome c